MFSRSFCARKLAGAHGFARDCRGVVTWEWIDRGRTASNSTERTRQVATGQGRSTGSARGTGAETGSRSKRSTGATRRAATGGHARSPRQSSSERVRELTALVLFGVAIFFYLL
jgi:hypothetical protein